MKHTQTTHLAWTTVNQHNRKIGKFLKLFSSFYILNLFHFLNPLLCLEIADSRTDCSLLVLWLVLTECWLVFMCRDFYYCSAPPLSSSLLYVGHSTTAEIRLLVCGLGSCLCVSLSMRCHFCSPWGSWETSTKRWLSPSFKAHSYAAPNVCLFI
jgi:hypothetical protein